MKKFFVFFVSREFWGGVAASIVATIILTLLNNIPTNGIKQIFSLDYIKAILTQPIPLYVVLILVLLLSIILFAVRLCHKPTFLKETTMRMGGFLWHWRWSYDKKERDYDMVDFLPLCPKCGMELRMGIGQHYHTCVNGHQYNIQSYFELKAQIKSNLRNKYPKDANLITVDQFIG